MNKETRDPWKLAVGVLGAVLTAAGIVLAIVQRKRPVPSAGTEEQPAETAASQIKVTATLSVDDSGLPDAVPQFRAVLNLGPSSRFAVRHVCMSWNNGQDRDCAHVENLVAESYVLSQSNPHVTYVFDRLAPAVLENMIAVKDLSLDVYPQGEEQPVHVVSRRILQRYLRRWLEALDAYYLAHDYDRASATPEAPPIAA